LVRDYRLEIECWDGHVTPVLYNASIYNNETGNVVGVIAVARDITERKQAEKALQESEKKYRTVFENTGSATVIIEKYLTISLANTEFCLITGYSREEIEGKKNFTEFVSKDDLEKIEEHHRLLGMDRAGMPMVYEFKLINKQGAVRNISMVVAMIPATQKSIAVLLDITERKEAERKIQEVNEKLSSSVKELEERTTELSLLSEMGERLQSCQNIEEACAVSAQFIQRLFPASQGAIYLISPAQDLGEAVEMWGDSAYMEKMFIPSNCCGLQRKSLHLVPETCGSVCPHITNPQAAHYLCVPLIAQGEAVGLLHLQYELKEHAAASFFNENKQQVAQKVSDYIALALSNLKLRETLRQQSIRDPLTGLFNRRYMEETLARELRRVEREKKPLGVIMFDIDNFKEFNDAFGHGGGDALLRELGAFLIKSTRGSDIVSRYGGDEFVFVLPDATLEDTRQRAEELRQAVKELRAYHLDKPLRCTISLGVTAFPGYGLTSDEILKSADTALYHAKSEGRDRVVVASTIA
jgi:diguanylate cyclase (GGDEF)-like protein/PAS domain S-box-containing protein